MEFMNNFIDVGWLLIKLGLVITGLVIIFWVFVIFLRSFIDAIKAPKKGTKFFDKNKRDLTLVRKEEYTDGKE